MCGIYGITREDNVLIRDMANKSSYRGPDDQNFFVQDGISLGFNHLWIDQTPINAVRQPFITSNENVLIWNGEIYDTYEPDTRWLARGIESYGVNFLRSHSGMWALAYFDKQRQTITLARDHFGTKPLFYTIMRGVLHFSSSLHSLAGIPGVDIHIDDSTIKIMNSFGGYVPGPKTIYHSIYKVVPGQVLVWCLRRRRFISDTTLYDFNISLMPPNEFDPEFFRSTITTLLQEAARTRHKAGLFLSGGLDSTVIAGVVSRLDKLDLSAYTTNYISIRGDYTGAPIEGGMFNETGLAQQTAKHFNIPHFLANITSTEYTNANPEILAKIIGHPLQDKARWFPRVRVARQASWQGCKVIYTGDFGDELFGVVDMKPKFPGGRYIHYPDRDEMIEDYINSWYPLHMLTGDDIVDNNLFSALTVGDMYNKLSDGVCSYYSMESRPLYCHQRLAFYALSVPGIVRRRGALHAGMPPQLYRYLQRDVLKMYIPDHIRLQKDKMGWAVPWDARGKENAFERAMVEVNCVEDHMNNIVFNEDINETN